MSDPEIRYRMAYQQNRAPGIHFCEGCRKLVRVSDKRVRVTKGWKCPDCRLVKG